MAGGGGGDASERFTVHYTEFKDSEYCSIYVLKLKQKMLMIPLGRKIRKCKGRGHLERCCTFKNESEYVRGMF